MSVVAVIPARGGSRGISRKNLAPVGGVPLLVRTIRAALAAGRIDTVVVSSDDSDILAAASLAGAEAVRRPAELSGDTASSESAVLHVLESIRPARVPEIVVMLQCTSPFTTAADIDALVAALDDPSFAAALTVAEDHGFLWQREAGGAGRGVNHDERTPRRHRQELPPQYRETGAGYAMRVPAFLAAGRRFCGKAALVETDAPPFEIDAPRDLVTAESFAASMDVPPVTGAAAIRVLVTDFDGVHTDNRVSLDQDGVETVRCSRSDGMGIELLAKAGIPTLILSKEANPVVHRRAEKLRVEVLQGVDRKVEVLAAWLGERGLSFPEACFVGNDVNDVECLTRCGLSFAPADAHPQAKRAATHVLAKSGGMGAVREVCDLLLAERLDHGAADAGSTSM